MNRLSLVAMGGAVVLAMALGGLLPAWAEAPKADPATTKTDAPKATQTAPEDPAWAEAVKNVRDAIQRNDGPAAEKACEAAVKVAEGFGIKDQRLADALTTLARLRVMQGEFAAAEDVVKRLVDIREKTSGPDSLPTAGALNDLAGLMKDQKKMAEAEPIFKRALAIADKAGPAGEQMAAMLLVNMAELYRDEGKLPDAEQAAKRAVELREKGTTVTSPQIAPILHLLGDLYTADGKFAEAEAAQKRAVDILRKAMGFNRPVMMESLNHLADTYKAAGKFTEAEATYKESLKAAEDGFVHEIVAITLDKYADLLRKMKRNTDADLTEAQAKDLRAKLAAAKAAALTPTAAPTPTATPAKAAESTK